MTTRPRVAVVLGVAGLGVAVAQALLFSAPPTWFQIAVVAFWGVVGGAYLVSGLVQQRRDRARPDRHRVPDGELSTGGPGEDADVGRRDDVTPRRHTPWRAPGPAHDDDARTAVVPRPPAVPARPLGPPAPAMAAGRPSAPALTPAGTGSAPGSGFPTLLPGRPAPVATGPAAGAAPPPGALETTAARLAPWPHAAVAAASAPVPAPAPAPVSTPAPAPTPASRTSVPPSPAPPTAPAPMPPAAEVTDVHPAVTAAPRRPAPPAPPAPVAPAAEATAAVPALPAKPVRPAAPAVPEARAVPERPVVPPSPEPTSRPVTSPSFALRFAQPVEPDERPAVADTPRGARAAGRHAVPRARVADEDEMAPRRHRHRRPAATAEQPAVSAGVPTPARRHRTSAHRRAG